MEEEVTLATEAEVTPVPSIEIGENTFSTSTAEDYANTVNAAAIPFFNPELKFNAATDSRGPLEFDSEDFQAYYQASDGAGKKAMLQANNKADAIKIAQRRDIFTTSQKAIEQDGILTQLGMSIVPGILSPSNILIVINQR